MSAKKVNNISENKVNNISEYLVRSTFTSGVWTCKSPSRKVYSEPIILLNENIKVQVRFRCINFVKYRELYLELTDPEDLTETILADCTFNIMDSDSNPLKRCGLVVFQKNTVVCVFRGSDHVKSGSNLNIKIAFVITPITIYDSLINSKCLEKKGTSTGDGIDNTYTDFDSLITLANDFDTLLKSQEFCHSVIKVGEKDIAIHKGILNSRCSDFFAMIEKDFSENEIKGMDNDTAFSFIRFLYTGKVSFSNVNAAQKLFAAGDKYNVPDLKRVCQNYILTNMDVSNVADILIFTNSLDDAAELKTLAVRYATENCKDFDDSQIDVLSETAPNLLANVMKEVKKKL